MRGVQTARTEQKELCASVMSLSCLDAPLVRTFVPRTAADCGVEVDVLAQLQNLVDVVEVALQLCATREALVEREGVVYLGNIELIERNFRVHTSSRIRIVVPDTAKIVTSLKAFDLHP